MKLTDRRLPRARLYISIGEILTSMMTLMFSGLKSGEVTSRLEKKISEYFGVKHCKVLSTCRISLYYLLKALDLKKGDEVLLTPLTIPDIVNAIHVLGLKPVFVDMCENDQNIDLEDLAKKVTEKSRVLLLTYLCGIAPEMEPIVDKAKEYNLILLEDFSQNYGTKYNDKMLGTFGLASVGSVSFGKTLSSYGGGFLMSDNADIMEKAESFAKNNRPPNRSLIFSRIFNHLKISVATSKLVFPWLSYNILRNIAKRTGSVDKVHEQVTKAAHDSESTDIYDNRVILRNAMPEECFTYLSDFQSKVVLNCFKTLDHGNEKRKELARTLYSHLMPHVQKMVPARMTYFAGNTYWHFPIYIKNNRTEFQNYLLKHGIDNTGYSLVLCSHEKAFAPFNDPTPIAKEIKYNTVFLPIYSNLTEESMIHIARTVNDFLSE